MIFHHLGIIVDRIELSRKYFLDYLGMQIISEIIYDPIQKVNLLFIKNESDLVIELIEPANENSRLYNWLKKGNSLHHMCYEVNNIHDEIKKLRDIGCLLFIEPVPAVAFNSRLICFLLTPEKIIIELLEHE
jgi:methylmalonyl-CoA/ethylmalonyl-CoA epimerase